MNNLLYQLECCKNSVDSMLQYKSLINSEIMVADLENLQHRLETLLNGCQNIFGKPK